MEFKQEILHGIATVAKEKAAENKIDLLLNSDGEGDEDDEGDDEPQQGPEDLAKAPGDHPEEKAHSAGRSAKKPVVVFPWEFPEVVPREYCSISFQSFAYFPIFS